jgi:hypothetical protein
MALLKIPINLPPRQIRLDRRASSASTLSNSSEGDDVFYQRLGVSKSSSSKIPHSVKVRPSHEHNIKKDFNRSQGLQGALERIQKRRSSDPLYQGEKGADTKEVKQMIDLFSKYEGILEHLVHKNQKLKSFVNGETEVYPSQFSCTTVEILETLEKLNLKRAQSFANAEVPDASRAGVFDKGDTRSRSADPRMRTANETTLHQNTQETSRLSALRSRSRYSPKAHEANTPKRSGASFDKIVSTQPRPRRSITPKILELRQNEEGDMGLEVPRTSSNARGSEWSREDPPTNKPHSNGETSRRFPTRDLREIEIINCCSSKKTSAENIVSTVSGTKAKQSQTITDSPVSPESRNEKLSPPSIRRETKRPTPLGEMRASPPRLDLIERKRQEAATSFSYRDSEMEELGISWFSCYELEGSGGHSTATPRTPPKHFLPLSLTKKEHATNSRYPYSTNGSGPGSQYTSIDPSERARKLQSDINNVYQYSEELVQSQQRLRGDLQKINHTYRQRHGYMEDCVFQAMSSPRDDLHFEGGRDPIQLSMPQLSSESYTYFEACDGVIHVEEEEIIHLEAGGPVLESRPSYHIEDGVIVVEDEDDGGDDDDDDGGGGDDDDDAGIENHSVSNTIKHVEDDQESFPDILASAIPDSAQNGPRIEDETEFSGGDSMRGPMSTETDNENSLQGKRKSKRETIASLEPVGREVISSMHSSGSISTKGSAGLNSNKAELEFVVPAATGAEVPWNKKVNSTKAVKWFDHCGALPCGLASF